MDIIKTSLLYGSFFETLAYNNGLWKNNFNVQTISLDKSIEFNYRYLLDFIKEGGLNISLKDKQTFKGTQMTLIVIDSIKKNVSFYKNFFNFLDIPTFNDIALEKAIQFYKTKKPEDKEVFFFEGKLKIQDNDLALIRVFPYGIYIKDIHTIIETVIKDASITNIQSIFSTLSSIALAIIFHYSIQKINPKLWFQYLLKNKQNIIKGFSNVFKYYKKFMEEINEFFDYIEEYNQYRIPYLLNNKYLNPKDIIKTFSQLFARPIYNTNNYTNLAYRPLDCLLYAYETIIISLKNNDIDLQTLIINSCLHVGNNVSIGFIAGSLYGSYYQELHTLDFKSLKSFKQINSI